MSSKIVVVGEVSGRFRDVFKKISSLHAKNTFSLALIVGNLFGDLQSSADEDEIDALLNGHINVPVPTYFVLGNSTFPPKVIEKLESSNGELCDNLYFLGKRTTIRTSEGPRIVALGGSLDDKSAPSNDKYYPKYSESDAKSLKGANSADILVTSEWPSAIRKGSKISVPQDWDEPDGRSCVADLCARLKPRYHFSTSPTFFFEREPFFHAQPAEQASEGFSITRFISLAAYGNAGKQKWIYAFSLDNIATLPPTLPTGATASPLAASVAKKRLAPQSQEFSRFSSTNTSHSRPSKRHRGPPPDPSTCFFCLSNPNLATHLITSIGTDAYLTTAKGPLTTAATFPALPFPAHILIIPLAHTPTLNPLADPATTAEMHRYRVALNRMLAQHNDTTATPALGSVAWEISRATGIHTHWQWLPLPVRLLAGGLAEAAFKVEAQNEGYAELRCVADGKEAEEEAEDTAAAAAAANAETGDALHIWLWTPPEKDGGDGEAKHSGGATRHLVLPLPAADERVRFNLQYARTVLAKLLEVPERANWRDCGQSVEEETREAEAFKVAFRRWDFSL